MFPSAVEAEANREPMAACRARVRPGTKTSDAMTGNVHFNHRMQKRADAASEAVSQAILEISRCCHQDDFEFREKETLNLVDG